jgi:hypothetical protein
MTHRGVINQFKPKPVFYSLPPLAAKGDRLEYERDAIEGSERLRDAILATLDIKQLGNAPGRPTRIHPTATDRTGHRPQEITARPIGEIIKPIVRRVTEAQG